VRSYCKDLSVRNLLAKSEFNLDTQFNIYRFFKVETFFGYITFFTARMLVFSTVPVSTQPLLFHVVPSFLRAGVTIGFFLSLKRHIALADRECLV
jgi:hypothetical protein